MVSPEAFAVILGAVAGLIAGAIVVGLWAISPAEKPKEPDLTPLFDAFARVSNRVDDVAESVREVGDSFVGWRDDREELRSRITVASDALKAACTELDAERVENDALRKLNDRLSKNVFRERDNVLRERDEVARRGVVIKSVNATLAKRTEELATARGQALRLESELSHYRKRYKDELAAFSG